MAGLQPSQSHAEDREWFGVEAQWARREVVVGNSSWHRRQWLGFFFAMVLVLCGRAMR